MLRKSTLLLAAVALLCLPAQAQEIALDALLSSHFDALGGLDAIKLVQTTKATGRMTLGPGMETTFTRYAVRPDKVRLEFEFQGMTGIQAYDGETGWMFMPFAGQTGPEPMPADLASQMEQESDMDGPLVDYQAKGHQIELMGTEDVEGAPCYKLKVTLNNGDVQYYYIDQEYYLLIKVTGTTSIQGMEIEFENSFSDYKEVGGLLIPHSMQLLGMQGPGSQGSIIIDSIEMNVEIDDSIFTMPS